MVDFSKIIEYFETMPIPLNMLNRGQLVLNEFLKPLKKIFEQKAVPEEGWSDEQISFLLQLLSNMDTDKDGNAARVGEREARIATKLHLQTSGGFCHGIGRSGYLTAPQPKAPGGSVMYELANYLARHFLKRFGLPNIKKAIVVPLCTGMSLSLCLSALKPDWNDPHTAHKRSILIPQIDHSSILKACDFLGLKKIIIKGKVMGDAVRVPMEDIQESYDDKCYAILSITSFFPPRESDDIKEISKFAQEHDLVHVVINAYGVQSSEWMKLIRSAIDAGRIDAIIQSSDKNFLTPVGGAIIATPHNEIMEKISQTYAGRANATPIVQFLASALSLGIKGYENLLKEQQDNRKLLEEKLTELANKLKERILNVFNPIAIAMSLSNLNPKKLNALGGALYNLRVTGPRVQDPNTKPFGTCCDHYPTPYIVMNAAIGARKEDVIRSILQLEKALHQIK
ncbi:MAG: O-phosphoseryl-tRNA(Sec) selenium transferase [Promethearchaeota archaeon]